MGIVTGQGLTGLIREAYGVRPAAVAVAALVVANIGTTCAEFAGIAAGFELFGVSRYLSVPLSAAAVSMLVLKGSFHRVERVLIVLSAVFVTYIVSGADGRTGLGCRPARHGDTDDAAHPRRSGDRDRDHRHDARAVGPQLHQSYAADKRLTTDELRYERVDVVSGACLTGIIGFFVVVACAATLHPLGVSINDAADAAVALEPLAGGLARDLFALGLIGAALLAASILPLSTAYSVSEFIGREAALDDRPREAPLFYGTFAVVVTVGAAVILVPGAPLVSILVLTQILNAVLLLPLLAFMYGISEPCPHGRARRQQIGRRRVPRGHRVHHRLRRLARCLVDHRVTGSVSRSPPSHWPTR